MGFYSYSKKMSKFSFKKEFIIYMISILYKRINSVIFGVKITYIFFRPIKVVIIASFN